MVEGAQVEVWDRAVRVFHWSLVAFFFIAYLTGDDESALHVYAGYVVLALVVFRVVWGFVGTKHARFTDFIHGPTETLRYVKSIVSIKPLYYLGHNPLGGWMVVALLLSLIGVCWSGLEVYGKQGHGPLAQVDIHFVLPAAANDDDEESARGNERDKAGEEFWEEIHEAFSNLTLVLVFLHVIGVVTGSAIHRENLVKAMITGHKLAKRHDDVPPND